MLVRKKQSHPCNQILRQSYEYEHYLACLDWKQLDAAAQAAFDGIGADGAYAGIDYHSRAQTYWQPAEHLKRLLSLTESYVFPEGKFYGSENARDKIICGLVFWQKTHPKSTNWYMQQISTPQDLAVILALMRFGKSGVPAALEHKILRRMKRTGGKPQKWTGANRADIAVHHLLRGALNAEERTVRLAVQAAASTLGYTLSEGFQYDGSYRQHGPQLYIAGYGNAMVHAVARIVTAVRGTPYEIPPVQLEPLCRFMSGTYPQVIRGHCTLYNAGGRSLARKDALDAREAISIYEKMKLIDPQNTAVYANAIARIRREQPPGFALAEQCTHYWRSDYTLYTSPAYTFDVRTVSTRSYRNENGNDENTAGYFLADGAYSITTGGMEYYNIFPAWDFAMIPGTTVPHRSEIPRPQPWGTYGQSAFAGGLTTGRTGITAYSYRDSDFGLDARANKSYFMLPGRIVCLGSGITSGCADEVRTTLNQCRAEGGIWLLRGEEYEKFTGGSLDLSPAVTGVYHGHVGYLFCDGNPHRLSALEQTGRWTDINLRETNSDPVSQRVFTLYECHGVRPENEAYSYILVPGINSAEELARMDLSGIQILSRTRSVHAVEADGMIYAVFFEPGSLTSGSLSVEADAPCALAITAEGVYISNPDQTAGQIHIAIRHGDGAQSYSLQLAAGHSPLAGKTIFYPF